MRAAKLPPGLIVAPPASRARRWQAWHFAEELAAELARKMGWQHLRCLRRSRQRPPQAGLGAAARQQNLHRSFAPRRAAAATNALAAQPRARVYLVDDVYTTGATYFECARVLRLLGAREVQPLVLASVPQSELAGETLLHGVASTPS